MSNFVLHKQYYAKYNVKIKGLDVNVLNQVLLFNIKLFYGTCICFSIVAYLNIRCKKNYGTESIRVTSRVASRVEQGIRINATTVNTAHKKTNTAFTEINVSTRRS